MTALKKVETPLERDFGLFSIKNRQRMLRCPSIIIINLIYRNHLHHLLYGIDKDLEVDQVFRLSGWFHHSKILFLGLTESFFHE